MVDYMIIKVGERTSGTLDRLLATPLTEREIVMGYASAFSIIGTGQALLLLAAFFLSLAVWSMKVRKD